MLHVRPEAGGRAGGHLPRSPLDGVGPEARGQAQEEVALGVCGGVLPLSAQLGAHLPLGLGPPPAVPCCNGPLPHHLGPPVRHPQAAKLCQGASEALEQHPEAGARCCPKQHECQPSVGAAQLLHSTCRQRMLYLMPSCAGSTQESVDCIVSRHLCLQQVRSDASGSQGVTSGQVRGLRCARQASTSKPQAQASSSTCALCFTAWSTKLAAPPVWPHNT